MGGVGCSLPESRPGVNTVQNDLLGVVRFEYVDWHAILGVIPAFELGSRQK